MSQANIEKLSRLVVTPRGDIFDSRQQTNITVENRLALQPDFLIYKFFPDVAQEAVEIPFRQGNLIAFLNGFYPPSYNAANQPPFYLSTVRESDAITSAGIEKGRNVIAIPRMKWKFPYDRLYLYFHNGGPFNSIDNDNESWSFIQDVTLSTPYLLFFGRDMDIDISGFESENTFRYGYSSPIPNSSATATIDIYHGQVKKNIDIVYGLDTFVVGSVVRIVVKQIDFLGNVWIDHVNEIADQPVLEHVELPYRNSSLTRVQVLGGAAGETGSFKFVVQLKE